MLHLAGLYSCPLKHLNICKWTGTISVVILIMWEPSWSWQPELWWKSFSFLSGSVITFSIVEITLLSSTKQSIQVRNILEKLLYNKIVIAFNWKPFRVTWVNPQFFYGIRVKSIFTFWVSLFVFICSFLLVIQWHCLSFFEWRLLNTLWFLQTVPTPCTD